MDAKNTTLNKELLSISRSILAEGVTVDNCESLTIVLQSIIQCTHDDIYEDVNLGFLVAVLTTQILPSPTLILLANNVVNKYLYYHMFKKDVQCAPTENSPINKGKYTVPGREWEIYKERIPLPDGTIKVVTYQLNTNTNERADIETEILEKPDENEIENIFSGFLSSDANNKDKGEVDESDL